jgi:nitrate reductase delta subunit
MRETLELLATAYQYPGPGRLAGLQARIAGLPKGPIKAALERFLDRLSTLRLSEWEELYTATLDLAPRLPAYVGHAIYGEDYRRGAFMAALNREYTALGVALDGELPDHLMPVLRYLATGAEPLPELAEGLGQALQKMHQALASREADNPYLTLLEATAAAVGSVLTGPRASDSAAVALGR